VVGVSEWPEGCISCVSPCGWGFVFVYFGGFISLFRARVACSWEQPQLREGEREKWGSCRTVVLGQHYVVYCALFTTVFLSELILFFLYGFC
jgi:hypothetical protein